MNRHYQNNMYRQDAFNRTHEDLQLIDQAANNFQNETYNERIKLHEIENAINSLDSDKACGADYFHNQFLRHLPHHKVVQLLGIFNRIWRSGSIPEQWKIALIVPILKPGNHTIYRYNSVIFC